MQDTGIAESDLHDCNPLQMTQYDGGVVHTLASLSHRLHCLLMS